MHGQRRAEFRRADHGADVTEVETRIDPLRIQVHRERHEANIAGALAVAEETTLDAVRAGHHGELRGRDAGAPIVVRMNGNDHAVASTQMAMHPLDLVREDIRCRNLDGGGQVEDHPVRRRVFPDVDDALADLEREIELRHRERFGRILKAPIGLGLGGRALDEEARALRRNIDDSRAILAVHDAPEERRGRVVEMDDGPRSAAKRFEGATNELVARLREHLDRDVVRNQVFLDQLANEVEVGLRRRRKRNLDFLEADFHELAKHAQLPRGVHRLDQRLIAIAQVG